jgi:uncharacterized membrane protein YkvA (DUF1232 family)
MDELTNLFGNTEQLWQHIKIYAAKAGREATRLVLELYYVVKSPETPMIDKTIIISALGYQLLPDNKKLLSREKYGLLGLLDNGTALALAYNRVKTRVTPQIEAQVDAILNQWFGSEQPQIEPTSQSPQFPDVWGSQPTTPERTDLHTLPKSNTVPTEHYEDNEDVVID